MASLIGYFILFIILLFTAIHVAAFAREYLEIKNNRQRHGK